MENSFIVVSRPSTILRSANTPFLKDMEVAYLVFFVLFFYVAGILFLILLTLILLFPNVGFLGFPVAQYIYCGQGVQYAAIFNLLFNLFCFTYGAMMLEGKEIIWKKFLLADAGESVIEHVRSVRPAFRVLIAQHQVFYFYVGN